MAVDVQKHLTSSKRPIGSLGRLLSRLKLWTVDAPLMPRGYYRYALPVGRTSNLNDVARGDNGRGIPDGAHIVSINVEGGRLRYTDSGNATDSYGELYAAGTTLVRSLYDLAAISISTPDAGTFVNVSFYGVPRE